MKLDLSKLGSKIIIIGLSNAGKSTLAAKLSARLNISVCHLDEIAFEPGKAWLLIPDSVFEFAVTAIVKQPEWIMEGVYDNALALALPEATSVIYLTTSRYLCLYRYLRSCWHLYEEQYQKKGIRVGAELKFSYGIVRAILWDHPKLRQNIEASLKSYKGPVYRSGEFSV